MTLPEIFDHTTTSLPRSDSPPGGYRPDLTAPIDVTQWRPYAEPGPDVWMSVSALDAGRLVMPAPLLAAGWTPGVTVAITRHRLGLRLERARSGSTGPVINHRGRLLLPGHLRSRVGIHAAERVVVLVEPGPVEALIVTRTRTIAAALTGAGLLHALTLGTQL